MALLNLYVFLYVFSLSLPVFYHSAFFVGFSSLVHLLLVKGIKFQRLDGYFFRFLCISFFVYLSVFLIATLLGSYDLSFLKTFTNGFLSSICAVPLAHLILFYKKDSAVKFLAHSFFKIFVIQSIIILVVLVTPSIKPFIMLFHRNSDLSAELDIFSNGLRTNALSGGLFFGLAISYSFAVIISCYHYLIVERIKPNMRIILFFILLNLGLVISGRFGLIYMLPILMFFPYLSIGSKLKLVFFGLGALFSFSIFGYIIYSHVDSFSNIFDNVVYPYVFEVFDAYISGNGLHSQSTGRLASMYDIDLPVEALLLGDGLYTGDDGRYYMHTDVGFLRHLLFGGVFFVLLGFVHFFTIISPLILTRKFRKLAISLSILAILCSFKGEVFFTMVSVLTPLFLFSYVTYLKSEKFND